jgi:hypothetical protein
MFNLNDDDFKKWGIPNLILYSLSLIGLWTVMVKDPGFIMP